MNGQHVAMFFIGFVWGMFVMDWLYTRREMKRQERYWRRMLSERERPPAEFRRGSNPPRPPNPPPMRVIREGGRPPRAPEDVQ